ncbi:MAG: tyrosine-type recombinase/integrase [Bacteroidales bacterium]|nr:tyrosine-type recombinase/integrase [Bacteroidales bacterium]
MLPSINSYITYVRDVRRYSERTVRIYSDVLKKYVEHVSSGSTGFSDNDLIASLNISEIRSYEVYLMEGCKMTSRTVNLHLSALSGFCRFLVKEGKMKSNPVLLVPKPKMEKRLPSFYKKESMEEYFNSTARYVNRDDISGFFESPYSRSGKEVYEQLLSRLIVSTLYSLGLRRSELIGLTIGNVDFGRKVVKVSGKGDKMREIPLVLSLCEEILLYLEAVEAVCGGQRSLKEPLFVTYKGRPLYPSYVDKVIKSELGSVKGITGRKSPHVLRHSIATELLNEGTDLNSIKELLGHSSLAATQVYTHSSIARLKDIYKQTHPRAKNGGKHGD